MPESNLIAPLKEVLVSFGNKIATSLPSLITALVLVILGIILAKIISRAVTKILSTPRIEGMTEKLKEVEIFAGMDFQFAQVAGKIVYWLIMFTFLIMATEKIGMTTLSEAIVQVLSYIPKLLSAVIFFLIGAFIANIIKNFIVNATEAMNIGIGRIIGLGVFYFLMIMITITSLNQAGVDTNIFTENIKIILAAFLLALGLGYGLSSRDLMSNMLASFYTKNKFHEGQVIKYKEIIGEIISIDSNSVMLRKQEGSKVVIPLSKLMQEDIEIIEDVEQVS